MFCQRHFEGNIITWIAFSGSVWLGEGNKSPFMVGDRSWLRLNVNTVNRPCLMFQVTCAFFDIYARPPPFPNLSQVL